MVWWLSGTKPLPEPMMTQLTYAYMYFQVSMTSNTQSPSTDMQQHPTQFGDDNIDGLVLTSPNSSGPFY